MTVLEQYDDSPWHPGERAWQARAGVEAAMKPLGQRVIRSFMPRQHRAFFADLPMLLVATEDASGQPRASAVFGEPGFIRSPTPQQLAITLAGGDVPFPPHSLEEGLLIGLLGIDLATRRRNRVNGVVSRVTDGVLTVDVRQSFGNCNKYIVVRERLDNPAREQPRVSTFSAWNEELVHWIEGADTFFIASSSRGLSDSEQVGLDISHRGGSPGFIRFDSRQRLLVPDFSGNNFFNTLGNLLVNPRAGLLLFDFRHGDLLQLSVEAEVMDSEELTDGSDVERFLRFSLIEGRVLHGVSPWLWGRQKPALE